MVAGRPEPYSVMTYLSQLYHGLAKAGTPRQPVVPLPEEEEEERPKTPSATATEPAATVEAEAPAVHQLCSKCGLELGAEAVGACGRFFHPQCFCCFGCGKKLGEEFLTVADGAFCETCGRKAFMSRTAAAAAAVVAEKSASKPAPEPTAEPATTTTAAAEPAKPEEKPEQAPSASQFDQAFFDLLERKAVESAPAAAPLDPLAALLQPVPAKPLPVPPTAAAAASDASAAADDGPPPLAPTTKKPAAAVDVASMERMLAEAKQRRQRRTVERQSGQQSPHPSSYAFEYTSLKRYSIMPGQATLIELELNQQLQAAAAAAAAHQQEKPEAKPAAAETAPAPEEANPFDTPFDEAEVAAIADASHDEDNPFRNPFAPSEGGEEEPVVDLDPDFDPFAALKIKQPAKAATAAATTTPAKPKKKTQPAMPVAAPQPPTMEGVLFKQDTSFLMLWQPRFFSLQGRQLIYYHETTKVPDIAPSGTIDLFFAESASAHKGRDKTLEIVTPERTYLLEAPTEREFQAWLTALTLALEKARKERESQERADPAEMAQRVQLNERRQGWLQRLGMFRQWKRVWVVMRGGVIMYFKQQNSTTPSGKIALYKAELSEYEPDSIENAFEIRTFTDNKQHSLVLRAANDEEMHGWLNALLKQKLAIESTIDQLSF